MISYSIDYLWSQMGSLVSFDMLGNHCAHAFLLKCIEFHCLFVMFLDLWWSFWCPMPSLESYDLSDFYRASSKSFDAFRFLRMWLVSGEKLRIHTFQWFELHSIRTSCFRRYPLMSYAFLGSQEYPCNWLSSTNSIRFSRSNLNSVAVRLVPISWPISNIIGIHRL